MLSDSWQLIEFFNSNHQMVLESLEAVKLLMLVEAVELHSSWQAGHDVPTFYWLLFGRKTSGDPENFMLHHLNSIGKHQGLQPVSIYIFGYSAMYKVT